MWSRALKLWNKLDEFYQIFILVITVACLLGLLFSIPGVLVSFFLLVVAAQAVIKRYYPEETLNNDPMYKTPATDPVLLKVEAMRAEAKASIKKREEAKKKRETESFKRLYHHYLKSGAWKRKKRLALIRDNNTCQHCGYNEGPLDVHHITYENIGDEKLEDLICLCRKCHDKAHGKH